MATELESPSRRDPPPFPRENIYAHTKKLRFIIEHLRRIREAEGREIAVLDFGCGNGSAVSQYLMLDGVRYYGVDFHPASLAYARSNFGSERATFSDRIPDGVRFDVLVYADVLEHLDDPVSIVRDHAARCVPQATLVASIPNGFGAFENEKRLDRWLKIGALLDLPARVRRSLQRSQPGSDVVSAAVPYNAESGHVQWFTLRAIREALAAGGFRLDTVVNGSLVGAPVSERYLLRGETVARWNARAAEWVPHWAASTWLLAAKRIG